MKPSQVKQLLLKLLPANEPVLITGKPGVGKTDTFTSVAKELGYHLIVTHPVVDDPTDYKGMPAVVTHGKGKDAEPAAKFLPFGNLWELIEAKEPTLVAMDDLGQAPPAVQAAIMQLVLARKINGHKISDEVRFVAATNRRQDKAAVTGLITPLLDRFTAVVDFDFDLEEWIKWGLTHHMPPVLMAFARFKPSLLDEFHANKDMQKSSTPRSVAGVGRLLNLGIHDFEVVKGAAGEGFATEFVAFHKTWLKLPDRQTIYLNPESVDVPTEPDVLYALMGSLAHGANEHTFEPTVRFLRRVQPEFQVVCVKDALSRDRKLQSTQAFIEWASENAAVFGYDK